MKKIKYLDKLIPIIFFAILILFWQIIVDKGLVEKYILSSPKDIIITLFNILPQLKVHMLATLNESIVGFLVAIVFSIILAVLMDGIYIIKKALYPLLIVSQTIPIIVLAPLFAMWFGFGRLPKIVIVVLVCFFPIAISLLEGLSSVDKDMINLLKSMGASRFQIFKFIKFPASVGSFFSGLKIAATYSIMGAIIGEWLGGKEGLGVYMLRVRHSFAMDKVFAVILVVVILSVALFKLIDLLQYLLMPWERETKEI